MARRRWIAGSLLLLVGPGCHLGQRQPAPAAPRAEPLVSQVDAQAARFVAQHNRNANLIRSMEAQQLGVTLNGRRLTTHMNGFMAMERDRNFSLELKAMGSSKANIGSNDQEFWFWVDDEDNTLYTCDYRDLDKCRLAATFQPDWIMEAMGLRPFSDREAKTLSPKPSPTLPGGIVLTQHRPDARGPGFIKETTVNKDGQITEHRLLDADRKDLAVAKVYSWTKAKVVDPAGASEGDAGSEAVGNTVVVPTSFRLEWKQEKIRLDITIETKRLAINRSYDEERRLALFSEPTIEGASKQNLALLDPATSQASGTAVGGSSRVIETRPMPPTGGVRIGDPEPSPLDAGKATRRAIDPIPLGPDLAPTSAQPAGVVGAPYPTADSAVTRSSILGRFRRPPG